MRSVARHPPFAAVRARYGFGMRKRKRPFAAASMFNRVRTNVPRTLAQCAETR